MKTLAQRFTGSVYVDGNLFSHPNRLMGAADNTRNKVLKQLRENVRELLTEEYISRHEITLRIKNPKTKEVESIDF